eukprot:gene5557-biopygen7211
MAGLDWVGWVGTGNEQQVNGSVIFCTSGACGTAKSFIFSSVAPATLHFLTLGDMTFVLFAATLFPGCTPLPLGHRPLGACTVVATQDLPGAHRHHDKLQINRRNKLRPRRQGSWTSSRDTLHPVYNCPLPSHQVWGWRTACMPCRRGSGGTHLQHYADGAPTLPCRRSFPDYCAPTLPCRRSFPDNCVPTLPCRRSFSDLQPSIPIPASHTESAH